MEDFEAKYEEVSGKQLVHFTSILHEQEPWSVQSVSVPRKVKEVGMEAVVDFLSPFSQY